MPINRIHIKDVYTPTVLNLTPEESVVGVLPGADSVDELLVPEPAAGVSSGTRPTPEPSEGEPVGLEPSDVVVAVADPEVDEPLGDAVDVPLELALLLVPLLEAALAANPMLLVSLDRYTHNMRFQTYRFVSGPYRTRCRHSLGTYLQEAKRQAQIPFHTRCRSKFQQCWEQL